MTRKAVACVLTAILPVVMLTACGSSVSGKMSAPPAVNATGAVNTTTASTISGQESDVTAKGASNKISAQQRDQAQVAVNQMVTVINQLH